MHRRIKTKFLISTKADILTDKVNAFLDVCDEKDYYIESIEPFMSYTGLGKDNSGGYMIGCMIKYAFIEFWDDQN